MENTIEVIVSKQLQLNQLIQSQFNKMMASGTLFISKVDNKSLFKTYLDNFNNEEDPTFRDPDSSSHNCNMCNTFMNRYGNIIAKVDGKLTSIFNVDFSGNAELASIYKKNFDALNAMIVSKGISNYFVLTFSELNTLPYERTNKEMPQFKLGFESNIKVYTEKEAEEYGVVTPGKAYKFDHFCMKIRSEFINFSSKSEDQIKGELKSDYDVFKRGITDISIDTLYLVRDLIEQGSLLNAESYKASLTEFIKFKEEFNKGVDKVWYWTASRRCKVAKFRNTLIGVLCVELTEGMELNKACQNWNKRADPANYMRATAPITKTQIDKANKFLIENDYAESFQRRHAKLEDILIEEIKHTNADVYNGDKPVVFDLGSTKPSTQHKRSEFDKVTEITIDKFMKMLPDFTSVKVLFENRFKNNLVSLTTSVNDNVKPIFKWSNPFSWTFKNNLAGKSEIKEQVKIAGGETEGVLHFRLMWNDNDGKDGSDLDAWAVESAGHRIGFSTSYRKSRHYRSPLSGQLDVDIMNPRGKIAVENIVWNDENKMKDGTYRFYINPYSPSNSQGFKAEVQFGDESFIYHYDEPVRKDINVATVTMKNGEFSIKHHLTPINISSEVYGINTNEFHDVTLICSSPNHWGDNNVGNKHYMFMLKNCKVDESIRSFHNENLVSDLLEHRKVLEVAALSSSLEPVKSVHDQLSGLGFNATVKDSIIVRCAGTHNRVFKVTF